MIKYDTFLHGWLALLSLTDHHVFKFPNLAKEMDNFKREVNEVRRRGLSVDKECDLETWSRRLDAACLKDRLPEIFNSQMRSANGQAV